MSGRRFDPMNQEIITIDTDEPNVVTCGSRRHVENAQNSLVPPDLFSRPPPLKSTQRSVRRGHQTTIGLNFNGPPIFTSFAERHAAYERATPSPPVFDSPPRQESRQSDQPSIRPSVPVRLFEPTANGFLTRGPQPPRATSSSNNFDSRVDANRSCRESSLSYEDGITAEFSPDDRSQDSRDITQCHGQDFRLGDQIDRGPQVEPGERRPYKRLDLLSDSVAVERLEMSGRNVNDGRPAGTDFEGVVVAVGPGLVDVHGRPRPVPLEVGDRVLLPVDRGSLYTENGHQYELFRPSKILARFTD